MSPLTFVATAYAASAVLAAGIVRLAASRAARYWSDAGPVVRGATASRTAAVQQGDAAGRVPPWPRRAAWVLATAALAGAIVWGRVAAVACVAAGGPLRGVFGVAGLLAALAGLRAALWRARAVPQVLRGAFQDVVSVFEEGGDYHAAFNLCACIGALAGRAVLARVGAALPAASALCTLAAAQAAASVAAYWTSAACASRHRGRWPDGGGWM